MTYWAVINYILHMAVLILPFVLLHPFESQEEKEMIKAEEANTAAGIDDTKFGVS
jgi:hypothetical protein